MDYLKCNRKLVKLIKHSSIGQLKNYVSHWNSLGLEEPPYKLQIQPFSSDLAVSINRCSLIDFSHCVKQFNHPWSSHAAFRRDQKQLVLRLLCIMVLSLQNANCNLSIPIFCHGWNQLICHWPRIEPKIFWPAQFSIVSDSAFTHYEARKQISKLFYTTWELVFCMAGSIQLFESHDKNPFPSTGAGNLTIYYNWTVF